MLRLARQLFLALLLTLGAIPAAFGADWQVVRVIGVVWVLKEGMEPQRAAPGMVVPDNATVATMDRARALLRHGGDILNLGPRTQLAPQARPVGGLTTVLMRQGKADFDIEHLAKPHFAVQTPFLAAVVKGTRFTVAVSATGAAVSVSHGRVRVEAFAAGKVVELTDGQAARTAGASLQVAGVGATPIVEEMPHKTALVKPTTQEDSGGIVSDSVVDDVIAEVTGTIGNDTRGSAASDGGTNTDAGAGGDATISDDVIYEDGAAVDGKDGNNAGGVSADHANPDSNAGGNSANAGDGSNAGGVSGDHANPNSNAGGNSSDAGTGNNAGGNSNGAGNSENSNAGGNGNGNGKI